jgi:hypothetical protein
MMQQKRRWAGRSVLPGARWGALLVLSLLLCGCASDGPVAPLVPLPASRMPTQEQMRFRPWRLVVNESSGPRYPQLENQFRNRLKQQLGQYGYAVVDTDPRSARVMNRMLNTQVQGGGEVTVSDLEYEASQADGVLSVTISSIAVPQRNARTSWKDGDKVHSVYTSVLRLNGVLTLTDVRSGTVDTRDFSDAHTVVSYDKPHRFNQDAIARELARQCAGQQGLMEMVYSRYPLVGYVFAAGDEPRLIKINRGRDHGVREGREWDLILETVEHNALVGDIVTEKNIGEARTVEVQPDYCVAKCSSKVRKQVKQGMTARARGFNFWAGLFGW